MIIRSRNINIWNCKKCFPQNPPALSVSATVIRSGVLNAQDTKLSTRIGDRYFLKVLNVVLKVSWPVPGRIVLCRGGREKKKEKKGKGAEF